MSKKIALKILSFCLATSFFLPIFNWHFLEMSGLNFILSTHIESYKYFLLLIPVSAVMLFFKSENEQRLFFGSKTVCLLPLTSLLLVAIMYMNGNDDDGSALSRIDIGFWLILIFSTLLAIVSMSKHTVAEETSTQHEIFQ